MPPECEGHSFYFYANALGAFMRMHEVRWEHVVVVPCAVQRAQGRLTALLHGLVGPVLAVFDIVTHLAAVDTLAVLAAEPSRPVALCDCGRVETHNGPEDQRSTL